MDSLTGVTPLRCGGKLSDQAVSIFSLRPIGKINFVSIEGVFRQESLPVEFHGIRPCGVVTSSVSATL
jgi:hypothetical protein